jgi:hypothetical protein
MRLLALALAGGLATAAAAASAPSVSRQQAEVFQQKLDRIVQQGQTKSSKERPTEVTETEVNSYLTFKATDQLPVGVTEPSIGIHEQGRLSGRAIVDLDVIRRKKSSGGWFDPTSYLTGTLPITAAGVLRTADGQGRFQLETAAVSGIPIPKSFLQEIVSYYTRTPGNPAGINIDDPFELPAEIRRIDADQGKAIIVQ